MIAMGRIQMNIARMNNVGVVLMTSGNARRNRFWIILKISSILETLSVLILNNRQRYYVKATAKEPHKAHLKSSPSRWDIVAT